MKREFLFIAGVLTTIVLFSCTKKELPLRCNLQADPGDCEAAIPRFFYNQTTKKCEQFTWGGCGEFPFETQQECESLCEK